MFTLESARRPATADTWQDKLSRAADEKFKNTLDLVPSENHFLYVVGKIEMMRHRAFDIYQMLDLQKGLTELQSTTLSPGYSLRPNRIIIRNPRRLYMGFERSDEVEADLLAIRSLVSSISGRQTDKPTRFTNISLGLVVPTGPQPQLHGEIIHTLTDSVMPELVKFGRLVITCLNNKQQQTANSKVTVS